MAISFSGLASGMDTSSWVEALVSVKQSEITKLESTKATISEAQSVLNNIKSYFSSFESLLLSITDSNKFSYSNRDLFSSNLAESSNVSVLTATANNYTENTTYNIEVNQLASATEVNSGLNISVPHTVSAVATMDSTLFSLADNEHPITAGNIIFNIDNNLRSVSINEETTIGSFISSLESIGISASYNEESGIFSLGVSVQSPTKSGSLSTASGFATGNTKLQDLGIVENTDCQFTVVKNDGTTELVTSLTKDSTLNDLFSVLNTYGINASIDENGVISLESDTLGNIFQGSLADALDFKTPSLQLNNDETGVISALGLQDVNTGYDTGVINIITTTTSSGTASATSKLKNLGLDAAHCSFQIVSGGKITTSGGVINDLGETVIATIDEFTPESTLGDVLNKLEEYGIHASFNNDGTLTLTSERHNSSTAGGEEIVYNSLRGNLATALGFSEFNDPEVALTKMASTDIVYSEVRTVVHRDSTLGQIGAVTNNGVDSIVIRECDDGRAIATISTLTTSSTVQDMFNALSAHGISGTIVDGVIKLNSTTNTFIDGNIADNIGILQPIEETYYTTASTAMTSSTNINTATTLGALGMSSDGSVVIYSPVYGIVSVNIAKELTVQQFCNKINDSNYGIKAEIVNNKVKISELENSGSYVKGMSTVIQNALKLSVGEGNSYNSTAHYIYNNTDSSYLEYIDDGVEINGNTVISSIVDYQHGNGKIRLHNGNQVTDIDVDQTLTLEEFINNPIVGLAQYGLSGQVLSDGKAYITANSEIYLEAVDGGSNILSALKLSNLQTTWNGDHVEGINAMQYTLTVTTTVAATKDTKLTTWDYKIENNGVTTTVTATGSLVFKANDYYKTVNIEDGDTFQTLIDKLSAVGINAYISRGEFYIASGYDNVEYIADESSSSLASLIHMSGPKNLGGYSASSQPVVSTVTTNEAQRISAANYADMSTRLSTMGISTGKLTVYKNGQRADIYIKEDAEYENGYTFSLFQSDLASKFGDLRVRFDDGRLVIYSTDSTANISIGSTSDQSNFVAITGISSTQNNELTSSRQLYKMNDKTTLCNTGLFRTAADKETTLKSLGITNGGFTITHNGSTKTITIADGDTLDSLQTKIQAQFNDLQINFDAKNRLEDGLLKITSTSGTGTIQIGSLGSDNSNFATIAGLSNNATNEVVGTNILNQTVRTGSFKVGDADIYVQEDTTMSDIISQINSSEKSLATAYWDSIDGKLVIKSTLTGASAINIESGDTNFTELLGLTDNDNLIMSSQTIGKNAILTINGATYTSLSNNVTSDSTGLTGLTINLKGLTSGSTVQLTVKRDTETLKNAVQNVIDGYNELMTNVDSVISKTGKLKNQSMLKLIRNNIRTTMMSSYLGASGAYKNLSAIGIKSSNASAGNISTSNSDITMLSLDADEFIKAFESDEESMKLLLIGDGSNENKGIFGQVYDTVFNAISSAGYFETANKAYNTDKETYTKKIANGTAAIAKYRAKLEKKFSVMDTMIADMQNQFKSFLG